MSALSSCYGCDRSFDMPFPSIQTLPKKKHVFLTTCCFRMFHPLCVAQTLQQAQRTNSQAKCSLCRKAITTNYKNGKSLDVNWTVFTIALNHYPTEVVQHFKTLQVSKSQQESSSECAICYDEFPSLKLCYLPSLQRFVHDSCNSSNEKSEVTADDLGWLTKQFVATHPDLAKHFFPAKV